MRLFSTRDKTFTSHNWYLVGLAAFMVALLYLLQGDTGFNLSDEGFLWYGTIRTALGEIPVRDFQSYEPGRYYWGALWFKLLRNDGILALRVSQAAFQFIGLSLGLLLLRRLLANWIALIFAATILLRWMFPTWKIYEPVILIAAIYFAVLLIEKPSRLRHLVAGIFVGLSAFFGRNHGLYCAVGFLLLTCYLHWTSEKRVLLQSFGALALGIVAGYAPMLLMFVLVPGFFSQVAADLVFNLKYGTNLPLPVPWPWRQSYGLVGAREAINRAAVGMLYLVIPCFYAFALARLFFKRTVNHQPVFVASAFIGAVYLHYTFARPQLFYLAWTIPPFMLGLFAMRASFSGPVRRQISIAVWAILAVFTITALEMAQENYVTIKPKAFVKTKLLRRHQGNFELAMNAQGLVKTNVRGNNLWVLRDTATLIENIRPLEWDLTENDHILVAPYLPGLYAILRKPSPLWEIYFLLPRPLAEQQGMVEDLEKKQVNWALICQHYVDDRPELRFSITHGLLWNYLVANFEKTNDVDRDCAVMRRKPG